MESVPSDSEREFAKEVADYGVMASWDQAIMKFARQSGMSEGQVILILNKVSDYNKKADPSGRIPELESWERHKESPEITSDAKGAGKSVL